MNIAVPCGLIICELIMNTTKYVYRFRTTDPAFQFVMFDPGSGIGFSIVNALVAQIRGSISRTNTPGATTTIHFPLPE